MVRPAMIVDVGAVLIVLSMSTLPPVEVENVVSSVFAVFNGGFEGRVMC